MKVGELERRSGIGRHALRYYESMGLIATERQANNYRTYSDQTLLDVGFIQSAQEMGFSLAEIGQILSAKRQKTINCAHGAALVANKMAQIQKKITELNAMFLFLDAEREKLEASAIANGHSLQSLPALGCGNIS